MGDTSRHAGRASGRLGTLGATCALLLAACSRDPGAPTPEPSATPSAVTLAAAPPGDAAARFAQARQEALAKDVRDRMPYILRLFDGGAPRTRIVGDRFILVDVDAGAASFDASVKLAQQFLDVMFDGRLYEVPTQGVTVWLFGTSARFNQYRQERSPGAPETPYGLYNPGPREIFVNVPAAGVTTLTHEMTHVILESDFPRAPVWLIEGMASLYELPDFDTEPGQIHGKPDFRRKVLVDALKDPTLAKRARLDVLFALSSDEFYGREWVHQNYAMAREAMRWLDAQGKLWAFYEGWRDGVLEDVSGEKTFAKVIGVTPEGATEGWVEWVRKSGGPG